MVHGRNRVPVRLQGRVQGLVLEHNRGRVPVLDHVPVYVHDHVLDLVPVRVQELVLALGLAHGQVRGPDLVPVSAQAHDHALERDLGRVRERVHALVPVLDLDPAPVPGHNQVLVSTRT